jgi:hypothetical protein
MPDGMRLFTISMFLCVYWSPKPKKLKVGDYCTGALGGYVTVVSSSDYGFIG